MSGELRLIVNADDFGRSPGINRGIVEAHARGIVTSTTLMVNLEWSREAVEWARGFPDLGVGLHLNFCYGRPVSDPWAVPSLTRSDGEFEANLAGLAATVSNLDVAAEALAQLERFHQLLGRAPTHLDSHKYLHSTQRFRGPVLTIAREHRLPVRAIDDRDRVRMSATGVPHPDRFDGRFHGHEGDGVSTDVLLLAIDGLQPGLTELMCHPGHVDRHIEDSSYREERERELASLCHPDVMERIRSRDVRLVTFDSLKGLCG